MDDQPRFVNPRDHVTEIGSDLAARVASASCSCGWAKVLTFTRPSGEPVALRIAQAEADRHEQDPDADADRPAPRIVLLVTSDVDVWAAVLAINLPAGTTVRVYQSLSEAVGDLSVAEMVLLDFEAVRVAALLRGLHHQRVAAVTTRPEPCDARTTELAGCQRVVELPRDAAWVAAGGR
ncbi:hypothetical protein [Micromonospora sp. NPDC049662]|uniref:hypothetical protein n=1 Tax=Micromonospora sp. NPDC049662 TaxID=3155397 RepID=UPI003445648F